jgi:hypothetical protein
MGDDRNKSKKDADKSARRQPWSPGTTESSPYQPDHKYGHENRTGVGLTKTAIGHCESRSSGDPVRLTEDNAYAYKNMVSSSKPIAERSFIGKGNEPGGVTREYAGEIDGRPGGAYVSDRGTGPRINTTFSPKNRKKN